MKCFHLAIPPLLSHQSPYLTQKSWAATRCSLFPVGMGSVTWRITPLSFPAGGGRTAVKDGTSTRVNKCREWVRKMKV